MIEPPRHYPSWVVPTVIGATLVIAAYCVFRIFAATGDPEFFGWSVALCLLYAVVGSALATRRDPGGGRPLRSVLAAGVCAGALLAAVFVVGAFVVRAVPALADAVRAVTGQADHTPFVAVVAITALTGVAEELFFRGAVYARLARRPVLVSTLAYAAVTAGSLNPMMIFAALVLGTVTGLQRRSSGGIVLPAVTHVVWSLTMLLALPAVVG
ncbi:CPBP family intramembrane glutamic endopeptidase [Naumannella huperziae]